jgi:hypothetical protein
MLKMTGTAARLRKSATEATPRRSTLISDANVLFVIAVPLTGSAAADAHDLWKQNPWKHRRHSFAWNVHRQGSVGHRETSRLSEKRNVENGPVSIFSQGLGVHLGWWPSQ